MDPWAITEGIASSHHLLPGDWNEIHPYVSALRDSDNGLAYGIGSFLNSEGNDTAYVGIRPEAGPFWAELGLATGYSGAPVVPFGRLGLDLGSGLSAFAAPAYNVDDQSLGAVVGFNNELLRW